ncbi:hypothetical protein [Streptomyces sp. NPDC004726]
MNPRGAAAASVLLGAAVGVVTNLLTDEWSWTLGIGFGVLVCALVAVAIKSAATAPGAGADTPTVRVEASGGGRVTGNTSTVKRSGRLWLRATRRGVLRGNTTRAGEGSAELHAVDGEVSDNDTTIS